VGSLAELERQVKLLQKNYVFAPPLQRHFKADKTKIFAFRFVSQKYQAIRIWKK